VVTAGIVHIAALVPLGQQGVAPGPTGAAVASFRVDDALAIELAGLVGSAEVAMLATAGLDGPRAVRFPPALAGGRAVPRASESRTLRRGGRSASSLPAGTGQPVAVLVVERGRDRASVLPPILGITVLALLMAVGIALLVAAATTRPLGELGAAAARVAGGT
jgi:hypothetical protein